MKIDIYKSTKNGNKYLSVPAETDVTQLQLPKDIDPDLLSLSPFKSSLELDPTKPRVALNQEDVENQINQKGYAVHGATITIDLKTK